MGRFRFAAVVSVAASVCGFTSGTAAVPSTGTPHLYVCGRGPGNLGQVAVFAPHAHGNVAPERILAGSRTGLINPSFCAVDANGYLYVSFAELSSGPPSILVFRPRASGNEAPVRVIRGKNTTLRGPAGLAFDGAGNLYVADMYADTVDEFAPGAHGNVAPVSAITNLCGSQRCYGPSNLAVDAAGNVSVQIEFVIHSSQTQVVVDEFAAGSHGSVPPTASVVVGYGPMTVYELSIAGTTLYVPISPFHPPPNGDVEFYSVPGLQPLGTLQFPAFRNLVSAAADALGNVYVLDTPKTGESAILVFPPGGSKPSRAIKGSLTGLPAGYYFTFGP